MKLFKNIINDKNLYKNQKTKSILRIIFKNYLPKKILDRDNIIGFLKISTILKS